MLSCTVSLSSVSFLYSSFPRSLFLSIYLLFCVSLIFICYLHSQSSSLSLPPSLHPLSARYLFSSSILHFGPAICQSSYLRSSTCSLSIHLPFLTFIHLSICLSILPSFYLSLPVCSTCLSSLYLPVFIHSSIHPFLATHSLSLHYPLLPVYSLSIPLFFC